MKQDLVLTESPKDEQTLNTKRNQWGQFRRRDALLYTFTRALSDINPKEDWSHRSFKINTLTLFTLTNVPCLNERFISACCSKENKCFRFLADIINPQGFILENNGHFSKSNQQRPDVYLRSLKFMLHSKKKNKEANWLQTKFHVGFQI